MAVLHAVAASRHPVGCVGVGCQRTALDRYYSRLALDAYLVSGLPCSLCVLLGAWWGVRVEQTFIIVREGGRGKGALEAPL